jgi:hypothetical protein
VLAFLLAASIGRAPTSSTAFATWAAAEYGLSHDGARCVAQRIDHGPLAHVDLGSPEALAREGLAAVPLAAQQVLGDVVLTCALETNAPT